MKRTDNTNFVSYIIICHVCIKGPVLELYLKTTAETGPCFSKNTRYIGWKIEYSILQPYPLVGKTYY